MIARSFVPGTPEGVRLPAVAISLWRRSRSRSCRCRTRRRPRTAPRGRRRRGGAAAASYANSYLHRTSCRLSIPIVPCPKGALQDKWVGPGDLPSPFSRQAPRPIMLKGKFPFPGGPVFLRSAFRAIARRWPVAAGVAGAVFLPGPLLHPRAFSYSARAHLALAGERWTPARARDFAQSPQVLDQAARSLGYDSGAELRPGLSVRAEASAVAIDFVAGTPGRAVERANAVGKAAEALSSAARRAENEAALKRLEETLAQRRGMELERLPPTANPPASAPPANEMVVLERAVEADRTTISRPLGPHGNPVARPRADDAGPARPVNTAGTPHRLGAEIDLARRARGAARHLPCGLAPRRPRRGARRGTADEALHRSQPGDPRSPFRAGPRGHRGAAQPLGGARPGAAGPGLARSGAPAPSGPAPTPPPPAKTSRWASAPARKRWRPRSATSKPRCGAVSSSSAPRGTLHCGRALRAHRLRALHGRRPPPAPGRRPDPRPRPPGSSRPSR